MPVRLSRHARLIRFPSTDGLQLEGRLTTGGRNRAVALCHPHPRYGGSMLTPLIMRVEQVFQGTGYTTLAFNFRGVGGSEGRFGEGRAELADVRGALNFLAETLGDPPSGLGLAVAGYSFGSVVGGRVAVEGTRVGFYLGVAPPLSLEDFGFLRAASCRVALIGANRDQFADARQLETLVASLPRPVWVRVLETDHFFADAMEALAQACRDAIAWAESGP